MSSTLGKISSKLVSGEPPQPRHGIARYEYGKFVDADKVTTVAERAMPFGSTN
ncbi:MAG: hypothetical protein ACLU24_01585 [Candidatus Pseudoruminococcus sp.]